MAVSASTNVRGHKLLELLLPWRRSRQATPMRFVEGLRVACPCPGEGMLLRDGRGIARKWNSLLVILDRLLSIPANGTSAAFVGSL